VIIAQAAAKKNPFLNLHCFTWEKPADRQRFEPSLAKPLLLTIYSDVVLGGEVTEWRKRADILPPFLAGFLRVTFL